MKFVLRLLLSAFLYTTLLQPPLVGAINYADVKSNHKHYQAIAALSGAGLLKGYSSGTFRPDATINRAEAIKILVEANFTSKIIAHALDEHKRKGHFYVNWPDVLIGDWFGPYLELALQKNIVSGYSDKMFRPNNAVNLAEGLKMILGVYAIPVRGNRLESSALLYVQPDDWFAPYFAEAQAKNLINADKFYHPSQLMTRGEFAEIVYRLNVILDQGIVRYQSPNRPIVSGEYTVTIPRLAIINQPVEFANPYDGTEALRILRRSPLGHYLAPPGSGRKFVLYGHSSGYAWDRSPYKVVLREIDKLQTGDMIYINYQEHGYAYQVEKSEIIPEKLDNTLMANQERNELALYTCWPPDSTRFRYVVYGKPT